MYDLSSTNKLMVSEDYKERFLAEYIQLETRYEALMNIIWKYDHGEKLGFEPDTPMHLLKKQAKAMYEYISALNERARFEDINISSLALASAIESKSKK